MYIDTLGVEIRTTLVMVVKGGRRRVRQKREWEGSLVIKLKEDITGSRGVSRIVVRVVFPLYATDESKACTETRV